MNNENKYNGWLVSNNIFKRSFGILFHFWFAYLILALGIGFVILFLGIIFGGL